MNILQEVLDIKVGSSNEWRLCVCNFVPCCMFIQQPSKSAILLPLSQQGIIQLNQHFLSVTGKSSPCRYLAFYRIYQTSQVWSIVYTLGEKTVGWGLDYISLTESPVVHHCLHCTTVWYISLSDFWNSFFLWTSVNPYQPWLLFGLPLWRTTWLLWSLIGQRKELHLILFPFSSSRNWWHGHSEVVTIYKNLEYCYVMGLERAISCNYI